MSKEKRIVLITGAQRGIGYAIAEAFANIGDQPVIVDIDKDGAEKAAKKLANKYKCEAAAYGVDVANSDAVQQLVERIIDRFNQIDVLVNNAGLQHIAPVESFPVEKWDQLISVMLKGPFLLTKFVVPFMKKRNYGRIINISSVHGKTASPYKSAYIAAKHGVVGLTRTVAIELANDNITVNAILPGVVHTELIEKQLQKLAEEDGTTKEEALFKHLINKQHLKRFIKAEEVASACLFLASDGAGAITGDELSVSGGW